MSACLCYRCRLPPNAAVARLTRQAVPGRLSGWWNGTPLLPQHVVELHLPPRALGEALAVEPLLAVVAGVAPRLSCRPYRDSRMSPNMACRPESRTSAASLRACGAFRIS